MTPARGWPFALGLVITAAALGFTAWAIVLGFGTPDAVLDRDLNAAAAPPPERDVVTLVVELGDSAQSIAARLVALGVIDSARRFETQVQLRGWEDELVSGSYDLEPGLTTSEIIERIHNGVTSPLAVTIPEGLRLEEIAERLEEAGIVSAAEFLRATRLAANRAGTFAGRLPAAVPIEGYLFPSRYRFPLRVTADDVVRAMLERFDEQFTPERLATIEAAGRTVHEVLIVGSIVEREALLDEERPVIAAVFWNRVLATIPLQADPTVQYAVANSPANVARFGYWKAELTAADLQLNSPYNTYVAGGLPPTPIASPGLASIDAAIDPERVEFLYFVARGDGSHAFAITFEQHQANVERFLGGGDGSDQADEEAQ